MGGLHGVAHQRPRPGVSGADQSAVLCVSQIQIHVCHPGHNGLLGCHGSLLLPWSRKGLKRQATNVWLVVYPRVSHWRCARLCWASWHCTLQAPSSITNKLLVVASFKLQGGPQQLEVAAHPVAGSSGSWSLAF